MKDGESSLRPTNPETIPEPQKYGWCACCGKPLSEFDFFATFKNLCSECSSNQVKDSKQTYCLLHDKLPRHLQTNKIQYLIDSRAYKNHSLTEFIQPITTPQKVVE